jgi:hypothetical protein
MKSVRIALLFVFITLFSLACGSATQSVSSGGGPKGFTAEASPDGSVKLKWEAVENAQSYLLEQQLDGYDFFIPVDELAADQTSYEDYMAPEESKLTYRLQATTNGKPGEYSTASVTTPLVQPNPLMVQATFAEDQVVTQSIGPEGGSLSLTDQNGVIYDLQVPAGAVLEAMDFTLTPVSDIQGWPLDGTNLGSVRIGPENLDLYADLTLTITLPDGFPQDGTLPVGYGFDGTGEEFHIFPPGVADTGTSRLPSGSGFQPISFVTQTNDKTSKQMVDRAGSQGVGTGTKESIITFVVGQPVTDSGIKSRQQQVAQHAANNKAITNSSQKLLAILKRLNKIEADNKLLNCKTITALLHDANRLYTSDSISTRLELDNIYGEISQKLIKDLNYVIDNGVTECINSSPGKSPPQRNCLEKLLYELSHPAANTQDLTRGFEKSKTQEDFLKALITLRDKCSPPAYQLISPLVRSKPICNYEKDFQIQIGDTFPAFYTFTSEGLDGGTITVEQSLQSGLKSTGIGTYGIKPSEDGTQVTLSVVWSEMKSCKGGYCMTAPKGSLPSGDWLLRLVPGADCK